MLREIVQSGMDDGSLQPGDPRIITFTLNGALNWIGRWFEPSGQMSPELIAANMVRKLLEGWKSGEFPKRVAPRDAKVIGPLSGP